MTKSYSRDVNILIKILKNQSKIVETINYFGCNQSNLDKNTMAFDLCAFYMAQIGEIAKLLTDSTKKSLKSFDARKLQVFRNIIDHAYDKVDKELLKAYIFRMISPQVTMEIKRRVQYCMQHKNRDKK